MQEANRDMFPTEDTIKRFKDIAPLIENAIVDDAFLRHETAANGAKCQYRWLGRIAIVSIAVSAIWTVSEALFYEMPGLDLLDIVSVSIVAVSLGVVGIVLQTYIMATHQKQKWLLNRFAAERLRAIKFLGYPLAELASDTTQLQERADGFFRTQVDRLHNELNAGITVFETFSPAAAIPAWVEQPSSAAVTPSLASKAREAYHELRLGYQKRFASDQLRQLREHQRYIHSVADLLYLTGAVLAVAALVVKIASGGHSEYSPLIDCLAVAVFIAAMSVAILDNASLSEHSKSRFAQYERDLEEAESEFGHDNVPLLTIVRRVERIALGELDTFCRAAEKISYRI